MNRFLLGKLLGIFLCVLLLSACSGKRQVVVQEKSGKLLSCIAVLPTGTLIHRQENVSYKQAENIKKGMKQVDNILVDKLNDKGKFRFITQKQVDAVMTLKKDDQLDQLRMIADKSSCDGILATSISRYRQRVGSSVSVDSAASATVHMKLISSSSGQVLWEDVFHETQEALLNNLLSLKKVAKHGFRWITVEELVDNGVEELLAQCPYIADN